MDRKKVLAGVGIALVGVAAGASGMNIYNNNQMVDELAGLNAQIVALQNQEPVVVEKPVIVEKTTVKEVPVEVIKEVIVQNNVTVEDTAFIEKVCSRLVYEDIEECKAEVNAEDNAIKKAIYFVEKNLAKELEDEDIVSKAKYVNIIKTYYDFEDIEVVNSDYKDDFYEFVFRYRIKNTLTEDRYYINVTSRVVDGEVSIIEVEKE